jgi:hypothetical protein
MRMLFHRCSVVVVVLAALAAPGCQDRREYREPPAETQHWLMRKLVYEGYVDWARMNPTKQCPETLKEVTDQTERADTRDVWGHEMRFYCGDMLPPAAARDGFGVVSDGPDGKHGTSDDLHSWD